MWGCAQSRVWIERKHVVINEVLMITDENWKREESQNTTWPINWRSVLSRLYDNMFTAFEAAQRASDPSGEADVASVHKIITLYKSFHFVMTRNTDWKFEYSRSLRFCVFDKLTRTISIMFFRFL